ncbi:phosphate-selective porin O and P [Pseudoxanthomonas suwonensis 11-1]|uniref:Phosphate-selective porin O and P n=1 Tax=Pseudoxanthomonas suwonensis (strain 11-1) TaxID=743721 RepID=E6WR43_PSEUU|nr:OprO/OprP family phosphate-selective porin [Pseudoxanthomonas suwonensis]ADV26788.1 phosphate-selective porin O and P [Pseudoxanthomonas suwonensis 11-1]
MLPAKTPTLSRLSLSLALLLAGAASAAHAEVAIDVIGGSEISFEGLVQADGNWFDNDLADLNGAGANGSDSEFELRRAELVLKGKGPGNIDWVVGYDAKADKYLDVNARYKFGGNGNTFLQLGQFKQPNSLEELSSTKNNDFISKATVTNTFATARRLGAAAGYGDGNWSVTASVFGRELTRNLAHGSGHGVRATWAPVNGEGNVVHLGLSYVDNDTDTLRLRARPNADLATQRLVDTGTLANTDRLRTVGLEGMWIKGPFKLQGEYYSADVSRYGEGVGDFGGDGWYLSGLWNITGETWGYRSGVPTTGLPDAPASGKWQLGLRYDTLDLDDGRLLAAAVPGGAPRVDGVLGGKQDAWTIGANWYWRSNFKFALNYVMVDSSRYSASAGTVVDDNPNILEARAQFHW